MTQKNTIRILVDDFEELNAKSALPNLGSFSNKVVDINTTKLAKNIDSMLANLFNVLSNSTLTSECFEVETIRFTMQLNSTGEVSIVSLAKGSISRSSGLEFTIVKKA